METEEESLDESALMSPFTKFLTEGNRRINQQCVDEVVSPPLPAVIFQTTPDIRAQTISPICYENNEDKVDETALIILNEN
jgi:hypothetical protein